MSVFPLPEASEAAQSSAAEPPALRLVPPHEHVWQLRAVEYDESFEVRRYECSGCDDVLYR